VNFRLAAGKAINMNSEQIQIQSKDYTLLNLAFMAAISVMTGILMVVDLSFLFKVYPLNSALTNELFSTWTHLVKPEREIEFYRFFVLSAIGLQSIGCYFFRNRLNQESVFKTLRKAFVIELLVVVATLLIISIISVPGYLDLMKFLFFVCLGSVVFNSLMSG